MAFIFNWFFIECCLAIFIFPFCHLPFSTLRSPLVLLLVFRSHTQVFPLFNRACNSIRSTIVIIKSLEWMSECLREREGKPRKNAIFKRSECFKWFRFICGAYTSHIFLLLFFWRTTIGVNQFYLFRPNVNTLHFSLCYRSSFGISHGPLTDGWYQLISVFTIHHISKRPKLKMLQQ